MKINLVSKSLENYLLNKLNVDKIEDIDLNKVEEISINAIEENGNLGDYDFKDFVQFENLKYISLQNFTINNYETNEINRCKHIKAIQFSNCTMKSKSRLQINVKVISFDNCKRFKLYYISLLKNLQVLKISDFKVINLTNIKSLRNLEKIYFDNGRIFNFAKLKDLKNLMHVRIVRCKWNKRAEKKLSEQIEIEK